jgi:hypothetical protein
MEDPMIAHVSVGVKDVEASRASAEGSDTIRGRRFVMRMLWLGATGTVRARMPSVFDALLSQSELQKAC